jgi:hypothetical protein
MTNEHGDAGKPDHPTIQARIAENEVEEMLKRVGKNGGDKATLWDCLVELRALAKAVSEVKPPAPEDAP